MSVIQTPSDDDIMEALRQVLLRIWDGAMVIVQGQDNLVPEPRASDYIVMTPLGRARLSTNRRTGDAAALAITQATEIRVQLDVHGDNSPDIAQTITTLMRDEWACQAFSVVGYPVSPLYTGDPRQTPFINGEDLYENRWSVDMVLQANVTLSTQQQFADTLAATLIEVDATYPPGG